MTEKNHSEESGSSKHSQREPSEGYGKATDLLHECRTENGFLATPTERSNYRRVWGRDSCIIGLASLLTEDEELIGGCRASLETLAHYQGRHGEIPSNVDPGTDRISYGGTAGRVDADLWFVIACGEFWKRTGDDDFLDRMVEPLEKVRSLLGAWEFNARGLLFVPPTGDWADEYLQSGYVLYDQLLYLQAQRQFCDIHKHIHQSADHELEDRTTRLCDLIRANYWFSEDDETPEHVYHEVLYRKGREAAPHRDGDFWMSFFSPFGYGYRFDGMANSLVTLFGVANEEQSRAVDDYVDAELVEEESELLPAFWPPITPKDEKWDDLQTTFSQEFKNDPYEYHNGGRWPLVTSFYIAGLAARGKKERAGKFLGALHGANSLERDGTPWSFSEFIHGKEGVPGGTHPMGWSAAAAIIAEKSLCGEPLLSEARNGRCTDPGGGSKEE